MKKFSLVVSLISLCLSMFLTPTAYADTIIESDEIFPLYAGLVGSGNGTLDIKLFTSETAENKETGGCAPNCLDVDDANKSLPKGGGSTDTDTYIESYITTAGELKAFYDLQFGPNVIDEIVLFLDLNETTGGGSENHLELLNVYLNPDPNSIPGTPDPTGDVSSAEQDAINQVFSGGILLTELDPNILSGSPPHYNLPLNVQGGGYADYAIFTDIDPYSLDDADVLLFNQSISFLSNGGESKFLSGSISGDDICLPGDPNCEVPPIITPIPEPATMLLLGTGLVGIAGAARRKKKNQI